MSDQEVYSLQDALDRTLEREAKILAENVRLREALEEIRPYVVDAASSVQQAVVSVIDKVLFSTPATQREVERVQAMEDALRWYADGSNYYHMLLGEIGVKARTTLEQVVKEKP